MRILSLKKLKPGMILAEPVINFQGVLLLGPGVELSAKNIHIFKSWGVKQVSVKGKSKKKRRSKPGDENEVRLAIQKELMPKFLDVMEDPVMAEIMRVAVNVLEKRALMKEDEDETS